MEPTVNSSSKNYVDPLFQFAVFAISSLCMMALLYVPVTRFNAHDIIPELKPYQSDTLHGKTPIEIGLHVINFSKSDVIKSDFAFEGAVWFVYDPTKVSREHIGAFALEQGTILYKGEPVYLEKGDREVAYFPIRAEFSVQLQYEKFPLDDHRLHIILKNDALPVDTYYLRAEGKNFTLAPHAQVHNCAIGGAQVQTGTAEHVIRTCSFVEEFKTNQALFLFDCERIDMRHFLNILLPLYMIFFIALFGFSFTYSVHLTDVPGIVATTIPALFAYRFVIETMSPDVNYFMLSDYLFFLFLALTFFVFLAVAWGLNKSLQVKKMIIVGSYAMMLIGCSVIMYWP